ncbi:MAG: ParB-like partition protein [Candidatus Doudnabacteria bacterium]|nr:ParB-like partition protein [Candidatus Doudnabacteria bacterium]
MPRKSRTLDSDSNVVVGMVLEIDRSEILRDPTQPRKYFDPIELKELEDSIKTTGQHTPIEVCVLTEEEIAKNPGMRFRLNIGERRWRASGAVDPNYKLRAIISERRSPEKQHEHAFLENVGRVDMTVMEVALGLQKMQQDRGNCTQGELASLCARDSAWVSKHLSLLKLDSRVQALLNPELPKDQQLGVNTAVMLVPFPFDRQLQMARYIIGSDMNLKEARFYIGQQLQSLRGGAKVDGRRMRPSDDYRRVESFLNRLTLDTKIVMDMPMSQFKKMFEHRDDKDKQRMLRSIAKAQSQMQQLHEAIDGQSVKAPPGVLSIVSRVAANR